MAYATSITIATGNKVSMNYQSQDVSVSLTYQLERDDTDILALVDRKAVEVERAHRRAWHRIRDERLAEQAKANGNNGVNGNNGANESKVPPTPSDDESTTTQPVSDSIQANGQVAGAVSVDTLPAASAEQPVAQTAESTQPRPPLPAKPLPARQVVTRPNANGTARPAGHTDKPVTETQKNAIASLSARLGISDEELSRRIDIRCGKKSVAEMNELQATSLIMELQRNASVIAGNRPPAAPAPNNGIGETPSHEEPQGGNGHGKRTRRAAARN